MSHFLRHAMLSFFFALITLLPALGQDSTHQQGDEYTKVITQRAEKIVKTLGIDDTEKFIRVREIIAGQYRDLSATHDWRDGKLRSVKEQENLSTKEADGRIAAIKADADTKLATLHQEYIAALSGELTADDVEKVKDGMTYGVLPITYKGYLEMIPELTEEQKEQVMVYLVEARERAMDAGSSEEKHAWFGKYKGKINNFLSAAGYDLKKAGQEWQKRRQANKTK
jgi:hypothetical protein